MKQNTIIKFILTLVLLFSGITIIFLGFKQINSNLIILGSIVLAIGLVFVVKLYND